MKHNQPDLDKILDDAFLPATFNVHKLLEYSVAKGKAKEAILALIEGVIGEDENELDTYGLGGLNQIRNQLRQEQRLLLNGSKSKKEGKE